MRSAQSRAAALLLGACALLAPAVARGQADTAATGDSLTFERAVALALANSFDLGRARAGADAARGRLRQARSLPNPVLSFEAENLSGPGSDELTLRGSQSFELGGKRGARAGVAEWELAAAGKDALAESLVVRGEVRSRYAEAQAARALVAIGRQSVRNAEELSEAVRRKVEAGAASPAEAARADVELAGARLDLSEFEAGAALAEARLASLWDGRTLSGATLAPIPERLASAPERADVESLALAAPELQAIEARARSAESNLALQKSLAMPDLELEGGVRTGGAADDEVTYVAGVSLPLPLFDRNAGNVGAAVAERDRTRAALAGARRGRLLELDEGLVALERARTRCEALHGDILPAATRSHEAVLAGYLRGRFDYVDVLDARRAMLAAARAELDAYLAHTAAWVRLSRTLGGETALAGEDRR